MSSDVGMKLDMSFPVLLHIETKASILFVFFSVAVVIDECEYIKRHRDNVKLLVVDETVL